MNHDNATADTTADTTAGNSVPVRADRPAVTMQQDPMPDPASWSLDPEIADWFQTLPPPEIDHNKVPWVEARAAWRAYAQQVATHTASARDVSVTNSSVRSLFDDVEIRIRIYRPNGEGHRRCLLYIHSGAFCLGDLDFEDQRCRLLAAEGNCTVVSVDYRLAPEHTFPTPLQDCFSVWEWIVANSGELSVTDGRFGVGGCSAGGALAAGLSQMCLDREGHTPDLQMLLCPVLDDVLDSRLTTDKANLFEMWDRYLGGRSLEESPYASPSMRKDLSGLPPAYIMAADTDVLRDQAVAYARSLWSSGVHAELHVWPNVPHAFELFAPEAEVSRRALAEQAAVLERWLT